MSPASSACPQPWHDHPPVIAWKRLLDRFADLFTRPSAALFTILIGAWVLCPGRRTVTRMIGIGDPDGVHAHDAYHRFLRVGAWTMARLWCRLLVLLVAHLELGKRLVLDLDDKSQSTALAASAGSPMRAIGTLAWARARKSPSWPRRVSVAMTPQRTTLTRTPSPASSFARPRDIVSRAPLLAEKWTQYPGAPVLMAIVDDIVTMAPPPPPRDVESRLAASRAHRNAPKTLVRNTSSSSSTGRSATRRGGPLKTALLTRPPMRPSSASTASKARTTSASRPTSAPMAIARPPAASISPTTREAASARER